MKSRPNSKRQAAFEGPPKIKRSAGFHAIGGPPTIVRTVEKRLPVRLVEMAQQYFLKRTAKFQNSKD